MVKCAGLVDAIMAGSFPVRQLKTILEQCSQAAIRYQAESFAFAVIKLSNKSAIHSFLTR